MKKLQRVVWSKGMFLAPQHFQAQDQYFEDALQFRFAASSSNNWGAIDLSIDQQSLENGLFTLRHCRGIMPDGLPFSMPDADEPPAGREIAELFPPTQPTLDLFLSLPEHRPRGRNFSTIAQSNGDQTVSGATTRYIAETHPVVDASLGVEEKPVQFGRKNFRLVLEGESLDGATSIRIGRITRSAAGAYIVDPEFVAPCVNIASSEYLLLLLRRQIELLAAKAASLSAVRRQKGRTLADFGPGDLGNFWLLHTINTFLPQLKHVWTQRRGHPEPLYMTMLGLAGALSTFSLEESARTLPDYDHNNLGECFTGLDAKIRALLETAIPSKCVVVPLVLREASIWAGEIADPRHFEKTQFFLAIGAKMGVDDIIKQAPKQVRVSPPNEIQRLIRNALPGTTLRHAPVPPSAIPVKLDRQYFSVNQSGILWDGIVKSRQVSIFVPEDFVKPELELLIVLE